MNQFTIHTKLMMCWRDFLESREIMKTLRARETERVVDAKRGINWMLAVRREKIPAQGTLWPPRYSYVVVQFRRYTLGFSWHPTRIMSEEETLTDLFPSMITPQPRCQDSYFRWFFAFFEFSLWFRHRRTSSIWICIVVKNDFYYYFRQNRTKTQS